MMHSKYLSCKTLKINPSTITNVGTANGLYPDRPRLGWDRMTPNVRCCLPEFAREPQFYNGNFTSVHEEIFMSYLCTHAKIDGARVATGFKMEIIYTTYCDELQRRRNIGASPLVHKDLFLDFAHFFVALMYIHFYPTHEQMVFMLSTPYTGAITDTYFLDHVKPMIWELGLRIEYTDASDAYRESNKIDLNGSFTCSVDTAPIYVNTPRSWRMSTLIYNAGKYCNCVYKFQIVATNEMRIHSEYGLSLGTSADSKMLMNSGVLLGRRAGERWIGDLAYIGFKNDR